MSGVFHERVIAIREKPWRVAGVISILVVILVAYTWSSVPRYRVIQIVSPMFERPSGIWSYEERTVRTWSDSGYRFFIWRGRGVVESASYDSEAELVAAIASTLADMGWERHPNPSGMCGNHFPEGEFLSNNNPGYAAFIRKGTDPEYNVPFACLAVWSQRGNTILYDVAIQTFNPSISTSADSWFR